MIRYMDGLAFKVHSPSCYELLSVRDDVGDEGQVFIRYEDAGIGAPRPYWFIHYISPVTNVRRAFKTRDAAVSMISDRRSV